VQSLIKTCLVLFLACSLISCSKKLYKIQEISAFVEVRLSPLSKLENTYFYVGDFFHSQSIDQLEYFSPGSYQSYYLNKNKKVINTFEEIPRNNSKTDYTEVYQSIFEENRKKICSNNFYQKEDSSLVIMYKANISVVQFDKRKSKLFVRKVHQEDIANGLYIDTDNGYVLKILNPMPLELKEIKSLELTQLKSDCLYIEVYE